MCLGIYLVVKYLNNFFGFFENFISYILLYNVFILFKLFRVIFVLVILNFDKILEFYWRGFFLYFMRWECYILGIRVVSFIGVFCFKNSMEVVK